MARGATISIENLVNLRHYAEGISLRSKSNAFSQMAGSKRTQFRGRGLEFEEVRHYQAGDELRAIDWRVTARTGVPHTKLFREERERPVIIAVDQRQNMGFGSQQCFKSVQAAEIASLLAWATLQNNDRIGGIVFNDHEHNEIRPARSRSTLLRLLHALQQFNQQLVEPNDQRTAKNINNPSSLNTTLDEIRRIAKPGSSVFIISDFTELDSNGLKQLFQIKRHCDVHAILVYDPMEQQLPDIGYAQFTDGIKKLGIDVSDTALRKSFSERFTVRIDELKTQLLGRGIAFMTASTSDNTSDLLQAHFYSKLKN